MLENPGRPLWASRLLPLPSGLISCYMCGWAQRLCLCGAADRRYYILSLRRSSPLDGEADGAAEPTPEESRTASTPEDGFMQGFTLKGGGLLGGATTQHAAGAMSGYTRQGLGTQALPPQRLCWCISAAMPSGVIAAYAIHKLLQPARLLRRARGPEGCHATGWCQVPPISCKRCAVLMERPVALFLVATDRQICIICMKAEPASSSKGVQGVSASKAMTSVLQASFVLPQKRQHDLCAGTQLHPADIATGQSLCCLLTPATAWRPSASRSSRGPCSARQPIIHHLPTCPQAPCSRIEAICKQKLRVDPATVLDPEVPQALAALVLQLQRAQEEAAAVGGAPTAMDPVADLKLNQLEVVQAVREHQQLMQVGQAGRCAGGKRLVMSKANRHLLLPVTCGMESIFLSTSGRLTAAFTCESVLWAVLRSQHAATEGHRDTWGQGCGRGGDKRWASHSRLH